MKILELSCIYWVIPTLLPPSEVAQSCQPFVQGAGLPGLFHCSRYPDSADPSVCISAQQGEGLGHSTLKVITTERMRVSSLQNFYAWSGFFFTDISLSKFSVYRTNMCFFPWKFYKLGREDVFIYSLDVFWKFQGQMSDFLAILFFFVLLFGLPAFQRSLFVNVVFVLCLLAILIWFAMNIIINVKFIELCFWTWS